MDKIFFYIIAPIIVTVIAGMLLFQYTSTSSEKAGELTWNIEAISSLSVNNQEFYSVVLRVHNSLNKRVENLEVEIDSGTPSLETIITVSLQGKEIEDFSVQESGTLLTINLPSLRSGETALFQVFQKTNSKPKFFYAVRSQNKIAERSLQTTNLRTPWHLRLLLYLPLILPVIGLIIFYIALRRRGIGIYTITSSSNDTAFALLHSGNAQKAVDILNKRIDSKGGTIHELSNLAAACALVGDHKKAQEYQNGARFLSHKNNPSILHLNDALILHAAGEKEKANRAIKVFREGWPKQAKFYERYSTIIKEIDA